MQMEIIEIELARQATAAKPEIALAVVVDTLGYRGNNLLSVVAQRERSVRIVGGREDERRVHSRNSVNGVDIDR